MKTLRTINYLMLICIIPFLFQGCNSPEAGRRNTKGELKGTISISGAFALYPMVVKWAEEFQKLNQGVRIDVSAGGAGKGMTDALSGMVNLGMVSREINPAEIEQGAWFLAVTKDAVLPTINSQNPVRDELLKKGFTQEIFKEIFLSDNTHTWGEFIGLPDLNKIDVYNRSDACGAAEMWGKYLGKNQESLKGVGVFGDPGIADAVKNDQYGLGFNNVIYAYDIKSRKKYEGLEIIPIDLNGNRVIDADENFYGSLDTIMRAIQTGRYPSPPARDLYLVSKDKPTDPVIIAFLDWILTDGQQFVHEGGYVELSEDKVINEKLKLK